ncbi:cupredoxin domain-containing protein [Natronoglomus mannanivorans]|uniref:Blue (type 1) copper domain-containing protein n=1 Tax=Natronoglomus mannanivorans TaxID=2979990 RepID=A0AAP2Z1V5_9EURY|nr:hypothetical protein [Halobacteria archaeon AArc-xg1-1]
MNSDDTLSRRSALTAMGVTASSLFLAGCNDEGPGEPGEGEAPGVDEPEDADDGAVGDEAEAEDDEERVEDETAGNDADDADAERDVDEDDVEEDDEWADVEEIVLSGYVSEWTGMAPDVIDQEENPTLVLYEDREYDITWQNDDGNEHNLAIMAENDELLVATEFFEEEGESATVTFEATEQVASYVCENHPDTMAGEIEIRSE